MTYPEHIQWIIDNRTEDLDQALSQDNSHKIIDNPLDVILSADPTDKKKLTQWLVDTYIKGGFRWEDIQSGSNSKVFDTLSLYVKHKSKLDSTNHIGQYDTLGSVYKDIAPFIKSEKSGRSAKRDEQARAYEESEVLIKSDSLTVVIPKTKYASNWWGRGTQWCTAGDKNNMFESYYKTGPLIIIIINGVKTQLFINLSSKISDIQFMDEYDSCVELKFVEDNWKLLKPVMEWALIYSFNILRYIPKELMTAELCLEAVKQDGMLLALVPEPLKTEELCLEALNQSGWALHYVPEHLKTLEICLCAVKNDGMALYSVPEVLKTEELCLEALRQNGDSLRYFNKSLITEELCLEAIINNSSPLKSIPKLILTEKICLEAIKHSRENRNLWRVPYLLKTAEVCMEAVKRDGMDLYIVPSKLKTAELCLEAVRHSGRALQYVPEPLITTELCLEAVRKYGLALQYVPEPLITAELCLEAVRKYGLALRYVPERLRKAELYLEAVRQNGHALAYVPESSRAAELCLEAVRQNGDALCYVPKSLIVKEEFLEKIKNYTCIADNHNGIDQKQLSVPFKTEWDSNIIKGLKLEIENSSKLNLY